jgi:hypothetical protein
MVQEVKLMKILLTILLMSACAQAEPFEAFSAAGNVKSSAKIYSAPPRGPLNLIVGKQIGILKAGERVRIVAMERYGGFSSSHLWYKIELNRDRFGWVYGGETANPTIDIDKK